MTSDVAIFTLGIQWNGRWEPWRSKFDRSADPTGGASGCQGPYPSYRKVTQDVLDGNPAVYGMPCLENCGWLWLKDHVSNWTTNVESCSIFIQYNPSILVKHLELMARFMEFGILWSPENRNSVTWWHSRSFDPPQQLMMGPPLRTAKCSFSPQIHQAVFCWNNGRI